MGVKFYLKNHLKNPSLDYEWTQEDNNKLFEYINSELSADNLSDSNNKAEVKQAFSDFFEPVGYILFRLKNESISLRIFPYKVQAKDSKYIDALASMIIKNEDLISFDYKGREDQIVIEGTLNKEIFSFLKSIEDEQVNRKDLIKFVLKEVMELEDNDIILLKKEQIFIKIFKNTKVEQTTADNSTQTNRYNGFSEDELQKLYEEYFNKDKINDFLEIIARQYFEEFLFEKQINNKFYEKNVYPTIQSFIADELLGFTDGTAEFRKGFSGYIFRNHFLDVFRNISNAILENVYSRNEYMTNWLKYYNGNVFLDDGKRFISPKLMTTDGQCWNAVAIYGNISSWFKTKDKIVLFSNFLDEVGTKIDNLLIEDKTPLEYRASLLESIKEVKISINEVNEKIEGKIEERILTKNKEKKDSITEEIKKYKASISGCEKEINIINNNIRLIDTIDDYKQLKAEKTQYNRDLKREIKILEDNKKTYFSIQSAVVKALTSKRKAV